MQLLVFERKGHGLSIIKFISNIGMLMTKILWFYYCNNVMNMKLQVKVEYQTGIAIVLFVEYW